MNMKFYKIGDAYKKGAVEIRSKAEYDPLVILDQNSPLIDQNDFEIACGKKIYDVIRFTDGASIAISKKS